MYHYLKISIICFLIFFGKQSLFSQGGYYNIYYNKISELDERFIDKPILLDFKSNEYDTIYKKVYNIKNELVPRFIRTTDLLLSSYDEVEFIINNQRYIFIENWIIHDDLGSFREQSYRNKANPNELIRDMYLKKIENEDIYLSFRFYGSNTSYEQIEIKIPKNKVKGFLTSYDITLFTPSPCLDGLPCSNTQTTYYELGLLEAETCQEVTATEQPEGNWSTEPTKVYYGTTTSSCDIIRKCATTLPTDEGYSWSEEKPSLEGKMIDTDYTILEPTGIEVTDGLIKKTRANGWNAGGYTDVKIKNGDYFTFKANTNKHVMVGISEESTTNSYTDIKHSINFSAYGVIYFYRNNGTSSGYITPNHSYHGVEKHNKVEHEEVEYKVQLVEDYIQYFRNNKLIYQELLENPSEEYVIDFSIHRTGGEIRDLKVFKGCGDIAMTSSIYTNSCRRDDLKLSNVLTSSINEEEIVKNTTVGHLWQGGTSEFKLNEGDYITFHRIGDIAVGLTRNPKGIRGLSHFEHGVFFNSEGEDSIKTLKNGLPSSDRTLSNRFLVPEEFKLKIEDGKFKYYQDNQLMYEEDLEHPEEGYYFTYSLLRTTSKISNFEVFKGCTDE